jgi:hypothetical protein
MSLQRREARESMFSRRTRTTTAFMQAGDR